MTKNVEKEATNTAPEPDISKEYQSALAQAEGYGNNMYKKVYRHALADKSPENRINTLFFSPPFSPPERGRFRDILW